MFNSLFLKLDQHRASVNIVCQITSRNSIIACWLSDDNKEDIKSVRLSKKHLRDLSHILSKCNEKVHNMKSTKQWIDGKKLLKNKKTRVSNKLESTN